MNTRRILQLGLAVLLFAIAVSSIPTFIGMAKPARVVCEDYHYLVTGGGHVWLGNGWADFKSDTAYVYIDGVLAGELTQTHVNTGLRYFGQVSVPGFNFSWLVANTVEDPACYEGGTY